MNSSAAVSRQLTIESLGERLASGAAAFIDRVCRPELALGVEGSLDRLTREARQLPSCDSDPLLGSVALRLMAVGCLCETISPIVLACARKCGSPIEFAFCFALGFVARGRHHAVLYDLGYGIVMGDSEGSDSVRIQPQAKVNGSRVDFLVSLRVVDEERGDLVVYQAQTVVECDGHEFHERTKAQAARDRARDRDIQATGLNVLRFTGAEIWADVFRCAEEVLAFLTMTVSREKDRREARKSVDESFHC